MPEDPSGSTMDEEQIRVRLAPHPDWRFDDGALRCALRFTDFSEAFGFMARVALAAEKLDHHPDWSNSWNRVDLAVRSHAAGGVTNRCFDLVAEIDRVRGD